MKIQVRSVWGSIVCLLASGTAMANHDTAVCNYANAEVNCKSDCIGSSAHPTTSDNLVLVLANAAVEKQNLCSGSSVAVISATTSTGTMNSVKHRWDFTVSSDDTLMPADGAQEMSESTTPGLCASGETECLPDAIEYTIEIMGTFSSRYYNVAYRGLTWPNSPSAEAVCDDGTPTCQDLPWHAK